MTVKQISEFSLKTERTVQRWVERASDKMSSISDKMSSSTSTYPADYDIDEVEMILNESSLGQNAVLIIMENARRGGSHGKEVGQVVDYEAIGKMIGVAVTQALATVIERLSAIPEKNSLAMIAAPEQDLRSMLNQVVNKYALKKTGGDRREAWGVLYEELYYTCHVSIRTRANNSGRAKIEEIERAGLLESSYLIMVKKLGE